MRRIKAFLLTLALLLVTAGTALAQGETLRFSIWSGNQAHLDMLNGFAESFRETHPGVQVQLDVIPFADYVQKVTLQLAGGNPPDIGWLAEASAPTFIEAGVLADVSGALEGDSEYDFQDFSQSALGLWQQGDVLYGIPFSNSPLIVYYNADMFEAAGMETPDVLAERGEWTWEKFREVANATAEATPDGVYGYEQSDGEGYGSRVWIAITPMLRAFGSDAWNDQGECLLDSPESVEAMTLYHDMIFEDESIVPPGERADFFSGNSAITITQLSRTAQLQGAGFDWGIAPLPSGPAGQVAIVGQAALVVFKNAPNRDLAIEFAKHITSQENVATMAQFFPPARRSVLESDAFLQSNAIVSPEDMQIIADGIINGSVVPSHPNFPRIDASARPIFDQLWRPNADVGSVLGQVCDTISPLLASD
ncbi:MAG: sugar ABC transporter substrate-binding protein [Trueperaceae bacterium]